MGKRSVWSWLGALALVACSIGCARLGFRPPQTDASSDGLDYDTIGLPNLAVVIEQPSPGALIAGGTSLTIAWRAEGQAGFPAEAVQVEYRPSARDSWQSIAAGRPAIGRFDWLTPMANTASAELRVSARDLHGEEASAFSQAFVIDSEAPRITSIRTLQTSPLEIAQVNILTTVLDLIPVEGIQVTEGTEALDDAGWLPYQPDHAHAMDATPGTHALHVYVRDAVGHVSLPADINVVLAETVVPPTGNGTPPVVRFLTPTSGAGFVAGDEQRIGLHVHDAEGSLPQGSVALAYSVDNARTWQIIAANLTPTSNDADTQRETLAHVWTPIPGSVTDRGVLLQVTARDADGNVIKRLSPFYNLPGLRRIAGGVFDDNGVSGRFALLNSQQYYSGTPFANLVRDPISRDLFVGDLEQGLRVVDGATGLIERAPAAGGIPVQSVARDGRGTVYGCNAAGIFRWNAAGNSWIQLRSDGCTWLAASKTTPELLYWMHQNKLYRLSGGSVEWVAFNGSLSTTSAACYDFTTPQQSCAPRDNGVLAVDGAGGVVIRDHCSDYGNVSGCSENDRLLRYDPASSRLSSLRQVHDASNVFYRPSTDAIFGAATGVFDEDPTSGDLFVLSWGVVERYTSDQPLFDPRTHLGVEVGLPVDRSGFLERIAGVPHNGGDGGEALDAHLELPALVWAGHPAGPERNLLFTQGGNICCLNWGDELRVIDPTAGRIDRYTERTIDSTREHNAVLPLAQGGFASLFYSGTFTRPSGEQATLFAGPTDCTRSPTDGQPATATNWPRPNTYASNYLVGLSHSDGYVYLAGYRNANSGCSGIRDLMIKRFSYDGAGRFGAVEHVAGATGSPAASEPIASGQPIGSFSFASPVQLMRENYTEGAGGAILIYQGARIRMITRINPGDPTTWTVKDVTKRISTITDFVVARNVAADGLSGTIYYLDGTNTVHRYALGSGSNGDLSDDVVTPITWGGLDDLRLQGLALLPSGELVFGDGKTNGQIFGFTP